jgi:hypothetical protein
LINDSVIAAMGSVYYPAILGGFICTTKRVGCSVDLEALDGVYVLLRLTYTLSRHLHVARHGVYSVPSSLMEGKSTYTQIDQQAI